jgi:transcriptional regulator with XRE-family HTH domain
LNALAIRVGVRQSHLWRIVHRPDERRASLELIAKITVALGLPDDYFLETRAAAVDSYLRRHPARLNRLFAEACRIDSREPDPAAADRPAGGL